MATTPVQFEAPSGLTLTLKLFPYGSDTIANGAGGDSATEKTNMLGLYSADVTEALTGLHNALVVDGSGNVIATYHVLLADDTSVHRCGDFGQADVQEVSGDSTAANNMESAFDGTGYDIGGIDVSELNTAVDAVGSDGSGLTEAGGTGDHLTAIIGADGDTLKTLSDQIDSVSTFDETSDKVFLGDGAHGGSSATLELGASGATAPLLIQNSGGPAIKSSSGSTDGTVVLVNTSLGGPCIEFDPSSGAAMKGTMDKFFDVALNGANDFFDVSFGTGKMFSEFTAESGLPTNFAAMGIESDGDLTKVNALDGHTPQTADHTAAISTIDTVVDAILVDTNELQGDWANGGRLDLILDTIAGDVVNIDGAKPLSALISGTAQGGTGTTIQLASGAITQNNIVRDMVVRIVGGTGQGQSRVIESATAVDDTCTVDQAWLTNPDNTSEYEIDNGLAVLARVTHTGATIPTVTAVSNAVTVGTNNDKAGYGLAASEDVYHADIDFTKDDANSQDEWTVTWFKNGVRITSGITSPTIQVVKRADGTDLIASTAMTEIGSTESYKYDEDTNRITAGEAVLAIVTATIDSGSRSFARLINRDSTS